MPQGRLLVGLRHLLQADAEPGRPAGVVAEDHGGVFQDVLLPSLEDPFLLNFALFVGLLSEEIRGGSVLKVAGGDGMVRDERTHGLFKLLALLGAFERDLVRILVEHVEVDEA